MGRTTPFTALSLFLGCLVSVGAETRLSEARSTLEQWVETRQLISKTQTDWQSDKELLEQSLQLFDRELIVIDEQTAKLATNSAQADKERLQAETQLQSEQTSLERTKEFAADFESRLIKFAPELPTPLQELLKPLLARIPSDAKNTKMPITERVQVLVGVLNELDKFNNAVTIFGEKRNNDKGEAVAVETVYVGLGAGYFVNDAGTFAGMGFPGANGWEWSIKPALASAVREVVRIYRNEQPARFISLPVVVK